MATIVVIGSTPVNTCLIEANATTDAESGLSTVANSNAHRSALVVKCNATVGKPEHGLQLADSDASLHWPTSSKVVKRNATSGKLEHCLKLAGSDAGPQCSTLSKQ